MEKLNPLNIAKFVLNHYRARGLEGCAPTPAEFEFGLKLIGKPYRHIVVNPHVKPSRCSLEVLDDACSGAGATLETSTTLVKSSSPGNIARDSDESLLEDDGESEDGEESPEDKPTASSAPQEPPSSNSYEQVKKKKRDMIPVQYKRGAVEYMERYSVKGALSRFPRARSGQMLQGWRKQLRQQKGNRREQLTRVREKVIADFEAASDLGLPIHDIDLRRWGMQAASEVKGLTFNASNGWVHTLKKDHRIVSRKITKFVTEKEREDEAELERSAREFVASTSHYFDTISPEDIYNTDQSGFQKEFHSKRTLARKGAKKVHAVVQSVSATTHSYTIQPTLSASGKNMKKMLLVLQEPNGKFGPLVSKQLFQAKNLVVLASKSGKLEKRHSVFYFEELLYPSLNYCPSLLYNDSWSGFKDRATILKNLPEGKTLHLETIPPKTTRWIQPCDKFYFRQYKNFFRHFSDRILMEGIEVTLHQRNMIIRLHSLCHNQFCSPRYVEMIRYSWYACGYAVAIPDCFETPVEFSFSLKNAVLKCSECESYAFLRCGWCRESFCIEDYLGKYHYCGNYVE